MSQPLNKFQRYIVLIGGIILLGLAFNMVVCAEIKPPATFEENLSGLLTKASMGADSRKCVDCHKKTTPKIIEQWGLSKHAPAGVDCVGCHEAKKGQWDALDHYGSLVAQHPNAKTCSACHEKQAKEFWQSRHAAIGTDSGTDPNMNWRKPPIYNKTMGCVYCHNGLGNYWPDKSVGRCDKCHARHTFSVAFARRPETCGECHRGEDHGNYMSYEASKHGEIFAWQSSKLDLSYQAGAAVTPLPAPVCATCHMDGAPGLEPTHDISSRLGWRQVSPIAFRNTWGPDPWEVKRGRMTKVCVQCHASSNVERWFLGVDLAFYQYNEVFKPLLAVRTKLNEMGKLTSKNDDDDKYDIILRELWHDTGRVYRASLTHFSPNVNEAYGYSPLTYKAYELIEIAAEKGLHEAEAWVKQNDKDKVMFYPWVDYGGSLWGPTNSALTNNEWYKKPDYWNKIYANVEALSQAKILTDKQWALWQQLYVQRNRDLNKTEADFPPEHAYYQKELQKARDAQQKIREMKLPGTPYFDQFYRLMYQK